MSSPVGDYITTVPRAQQENKGAIRTFTGRYINPLTVRARDISLEDIAHHLSIINRYTGASPWPLSVAQHSVLCARRAARRWNDEPMLRKSLRLLKCSLRNWIAAHLMHDTGEYLFNDIASPVKKDPRMAWYRHQEHETTRMIFCCFGLDPGLLELTKPIDDECFFAEARSFWRDSNELQPWDWYCAKESFLNLAAQLELNLIGGLQ